MSGEPSLRDAVRFNEDGLVAAVVQDSEKDEGLMMAWMNADTLDETLRTRTMVYWSRSRNERWRKGDTSGHTQAVVSASIDCDGDALLFKVVQAGAACHTGERSCFYRELPMEEPQ